MKLTPEEIKLIEARRAADAAFKEKQKRISSLEKSFLANYKIS